MRISLLAAACAAVLVTALPAAQAQEIPCENGPCVRARRPGTHFLVELNGGGSLMRDGGYAVEGLFGAGGKLPWLPLRFYFLTELAHSTNLQNGRSWVGNRTFRDERAFTDIAAGLRVYAPIWGPLRLYADALIGGSHQSATLEREGITSRQVSAWSFHSQVSAGLQFRLLYHLSLGLRAKVVLTPEDPYGLLAMVGEEAPLRTTLTAGLTWHF